MKEKVLSVTRKDCRWDYYRGEGGGGQKKNKTENCCRCTHKASGAVGKSEEGKSKEHNRRRAFQRMAATDVFKKWMKFEQARTSGIVDKIKKQIDHDMKHKLRVETQEDGKWKVN